jgi:hypothetical protein
MSVIRAEQNHMILSKDFRSLYDADRRFIASCSSHSTICCQRSAPRSGCRSPSSRTVSAGDLGKRASAGRSIKCLCGYLGVVLQTSVFHVYGRLGRCQAASKPWP